MASPHHAGASTLEPHAVSTTMSDEKEVDSKLETTSYERPASDIDTLDIFTYHERNAGRLVIDPEYVSSRDIAHTMACAHTCFSREARIEFGDDVAKKLKLSADRAVVLWPQPTDDPEDPQNVRAT